MGGQILNPAQAVAQPQLMVAQPLNDVQLVALVAAQKESWSAREAVQWATEIVAEAIVQQANLPAMIREKQRERADARE